MQSGHVVEVSPRRQNSSMLDVSADQRRCVFPTVCEREKETRSVPGIRFSDRTVVCLSNVVFKLVTHLL